MAAPRRCDQSLKGKSERTGDIVDRPVLAEVIAVPDGFRRPKVAGLVSQLKPRHAKVIHRPGINDEVVPGWEDNVSSKITGAILPEAAPEAPSRILRLEVGLDRVVGRVDRDRTDAEAAQLMVVD